VKRAVLVACAACGGGKDGPAPAPGSSSASAPAETVTVQLAGCAAALAAPVDPRDDIRQPTLSPRVALEHASVDGALAAAQVRIELRRQYAAFRDCYTRGLLTNPDLAGTLELAFAIQSSGVVARATADGVERGVARCIAAVVQGLTFPRPRDGNQVQVTATFKLDPDASALSLRRGRPRELREWTPFAAEPPAADAPAQSIAAVTTALRDRLGMVENCFDGARGIVRAMLAFDASGALAAVRTGGIGESTVEACVATALAGVAVAPSTQRFELACDFTRGGDAPLRVSPDAGYTVIELTPTQARSRTSVRELPARGANRGVTMLGTASTVLVVAEPDAPGHGIEYALWWAPPGPTLVAVKASGGAPVLLGMGDSRAQRAAATTRRVLALRTDGGELRACIPGVELAATAPLLDPHAMDRVLAAAVAACKQSPCEPTVIVGTTGDFIAKQLVATTSAARRAGFHQLSIGGPACER
jgi:hypothetical protein